MMRDFKGLGGFDANLRQLEGHKRTPNVAKGLPNACAILKMLDKYALGAIRHQMNRNLIELSDAGTLSGPGLRTIWYRGTSNWRK